MKIAHLVCTFPPYLGGMGNSADAMVKALSKRGLDVTIITPEYNTVSSDRSDFKVLRLRPLFSLGNAAYVPNLISRLKEFDIVHLHYPFFGAAEFVMLAKLIFRQKFRLLIHYHMDAQVNGLKQLIFQLYRFLILPILFRQTECITCASISYIKQSEMAKYYAKNPEKFKEISFGVDLDLFKPGKNIIAKTDVKNILFVGGLDKAHYFKGLDVLIKAISNLKSLNFSLSVVGSGDLMSSYKETARNFGVLDKINFLGRVDSAGLQECYNECDVFVLPSINRCEAFGLVLLEAMALARGVIASRLPGVDSVFSDGVEGYYVNPGDSNDLTQKIQFVLSNQELITKMGKAGRVLVESKYTWDKVGAKLKAIYENSSNQ
ncbi:MAG: glycosyltransferase family 4 protein [Candidatus Falkowbacteria bacterium]|nr:glycosyltransferase family 4 protein [Candidatus Falkowbacteria bacterium]